VRHQDDSGFLRHRRRLVGLWKLAGPLMLLVLLVFLGWLFVWSPNLVNPYAVANKLSNGEIERSTLELMALILPVSILMNIGITAVMIGFGFAMVANERRYLKIIDQQKSIADSTNGDLR
jgi:uncharacterized membrane protein